MAFFRKSITADEIGSALGQNLIRNYRSDTLQHLLSERGVNFRHFSDLELERYDKAHLTWLLFGTVFSVRFVIEDLEIQTKILQEFHREVFAALLMAGATPIFLDSLGDHLNQEYTHFQDLFEKVHLREESAVKIGAEFLARMLPDGYCNPSADAPFLVTTFMDHVENLKTILKRYRVV